MESTYKYADGCTDARDKDGVFLGLENLKGIIRIIWAGLPRELVARCLDFKGMGSLMMGLWLGTVSVLLLQN